MVCVTLKKNTLASPWKPLTARSPPGDSDQQYTDISVNLTSISTHCSTRIALSNVRSACQTINGPWWRYSLYLLVFNILLHCSLTHLFDALFWPSYDQENASTISSIISALQLIYSGQAGIWFSCLIPAGSCSVWESMLQSCSWWMTWRTWPQASPLKACGFSTGWRCDSSLQSSGFAAGTATTYRSQQSVRGTESSPAPGHFLVLLAERRKPSSS